jgi:hypothetical protein
VAASALLPVAQQLHLIIPHQVLNSCNHLVKGYSYNFALY